MARCTSKTRGTVIFYFAQIIKSFYSRNIRLAWQLYPSTALGRSTSTLGHRSYDTWEREPVLEYSKLLGWIKMVYSGILTSLPAPISHNTKPIRWGRVQRTLHEN